MNIIIDKEREGTIIDGINTILELDDSTFGMVIERLSVENGRLEEINFFYVTDNCEVPTANIQLGLEKTYDEKGNFIGRSYFGRRQMQIPEIFKMLSNIKKDLKEGSKEYDRITRLLDTRGLEAIKNRLIYEKESTASLDEKKEEKELLDKVFEIVAEEGTYQKFLDYSNNKDYFSVAGQNVDRKEYLKYLGKIFGNKDRFGNLNENNMISKNFYIEELDEYKKRYSELFDRVNIDRYVNPTYEFKAFTTLDAISNMVIRKDEEPEWTISEELNNVILKDMPEDLSIEEQAMYIYCKLCKELTYDEGYLYRDNLDKNVYDNTFSKEHLESIKPGSKITCWDFSRIFSKMVNSLDGEIEAVIISEGLNQGHYSAGFYTDNVSVMLEAINGQTEGTNDLMKAKNSIKFEGIKIVSDRDGLIEKALERVYPQVFEKLPSSIQDYMKELKSIPKEDIPNDLKLKIQSFIDIMKQSNIFGNEAIQTFNAFCHSSFFGEQFEKAYIGEKENENGRQTFKRMVLTG